MTIDESANGKTVTVAKGDRLQVVLHSTYWQYGPVSDPAVLVAEGGPQTGPGTNCPKFPGSGCGTNTQNYRAAKTGKSVVNASRTSCGEAMGCSPSQSSYTVTVRVR